MAFNVIHAENCWDAYMKSLELLIENNFDARNVFMQIDNTEDNYVTFMPHDTDPLAWYLRVNSDTVEGELGIGVGLDVRYDARRMSRVKGHGTADWSYRAETGRSPEDPTFLQTILEEDDIFPNASYQSNTRVGGRGQLHAVKDLLLLDKGSDKGIITFWHFQRDLLEYTRRKYLSKKVMGDKKWSDSQHMRIPCPTTWHFSYSSQGVTNNVYSRSLIWDGHIYDDIFRFPEPAKWIGGHMKKSSGAMTITANRLWQKNFGGAKERWKNHLRYWSNKTWIKDYFEPRQFGTFANVSDFEQEWMLKELAEQDYRLGAFEDGDRKLAKLQSQYYKEWVKAMKVADMTIAHRVLGTMLEKGIVSRPTKRALDYVDSYGLKQAILDIDGIFRVQSVQSVVNYILRSEDSGLDYREFLDILPEPIRPLVLVASLSKVNKRLKEPILKEIDNEILAISDYSDLAVVTEQHFVKKPQIVEAKSETVNPEPSVDNSEPEFDLSDEDGEDALAELIKAAYTDEEAEDKVDKVDEKDLSDLISSIVEKGVEPDDLDGLDDDSEEVEDSVDLTQSVVEVTAEETKNADVLPPEEKTLKQLLDEQLAYEASENGAEDAPEPVPEKEEVKPKSNKEEDEDVRKAIKVQDSERDVFVAAPYGGNRVNKTLGDAIRAADRPISHVYFPIEPFHYREVKRHGTRLAVEACVEKDIPMVMETRKVVPDWAISYLSENKFSEVRFHLNTLDAKKWNLLYPDKKANTPKEIIESFLSCYQQGVSTVLKISPIVPGVIGKKDVLEVIDTVRNWTGEIEIGFASFSPEEFESLEELAGDKFEKVKAYYYFVEGKWFVKDDFRVEFLKFIKDFVVDSKISLRVNNEVKFDGDNVSKIELES